MLRWVFGVLLAGLFAVILTDSSSALANDRRAPSYCSQSVYKNSPECADYWTKRTRKRKKKNKAEERENLKKWRAVAKRVRGYATGNPFLAGVWCSRKQGDGYVYKYAFMPGAKNRFSLTILKHKKKSNIALFKEYEDAGLSVDGKSFILLSKPRSTTTPDKHLVSVFLFHRERGDGLNYQGEMVFIGPKTVPANKLVDKKYRAWGSYGQFVKSLERCKS